MLAMEILVLHHRHIHRSLVREVAVRLLGVKPQQTHIAAMYNLITSERLCVSSVARLYVLICV